MAVAFDTTSTASTGDASSITTAFTVVSTGGADFLIGLAGWTHNAAERTVSTQTYAASALTLQQITNAGGTHAGALVGRLATPATGSNNMITTMSGNTDDIIHGFMSFSGCAATQSGTGAATSSAAGTAASVTVTGVADGMVAGVCGADLLAAAISCDDTERVEAQSQVNNQTAMNAGTVVSTGSVSLDWTKTNNVGWAAVAFPLEPSAAAAASVAKMMALLGVGRGT